MAPKLIGRRLHIVYTVVVALQILTTALRQIFDFFGPLWTLILANFLSIVFCIFGYYGSHVRRWGYMATYSLWNAMTTGLNTLIVLTYLHPTYKKYKSSLISMGTGSLSWFETRAPGCIPDWSNNTIYNCTLDPVLVECCQAVIQIILSLIGMATAVLLIAKGRSNNEDKSNEIKLSTIVNQTPITDLRPMTPRRVKRRSARSIQSSNYGRQQQQQNGGGGRSTSSRRSGHHSNHTTNSISRQQQLQHRYKSPLNRLIVDSETSYDEGAGGRGAPTLLGGGVVNRGYSHHQGGAPPVLLSPTASSSNYGNNYNSQLTMPYQQQQYSYSSNRRRHGHQAAVQGGGPPPAPPARPPSARSSYSNYHPARLGLNNAAFEYDHATNKSSVVFPLAHSPAISLEEDGAGNYWQQQQQHHSNQNRLVNSASSPIATGQVPYNYNQQQQQQPMLPSPQQQQQQPSRRHGNQQQQSAAAQLVNSETVI